MTRRAITVVLLTAPLAGCCPAPTRHICREITARTFAVERIVDGDTFKLDYDGESTSVRLIGIDAPEKRDPAGPAATAALEDLIGGRTVRLDFPAPRKRDSFGRLLCKVCVEGLDVGGEMMRRGHAVKYVPRR